MLLALPLTCLLIFSHLLLALFSHPPGVLPLPLLRLAHLYFLSFLPRSLSIARYPTHPPFILPNHLPILTRDYFPFYRYYCRRRRARALCLYRLRRMPRGFTKGSVPPTNLTDMREMGRLHYSFLPVICSFTCKLDKDTQRNIEMYPHVGGREHALLHMPNLSVCLSVCLPVHLIV